MAAGRSMTPFYIALGAIAVVGGTLIATRLGGGGGGGAPLTLDMPVPLGMTGPRGVVVGSADAPVEIVEYSDFECPFCARFAVLTMPDVRSRLIETGRVRWRFMHFPLLGHTKSPEAHLASACANRQGRFWEMHDAIYGLQGDWATARRPAPVLERIAEQTGMDMNAWRQCVRDREAWNDVLGDKAVGDSLGVNSTPTFYINGRYWDSNSYSFDRLREYVDSISPPVPAPNP